MKAHRRRVEKAIHDKRVIENLPKTINETRAKVIEWPVEAARSGIEFVGSTAEEYIHEPIEAGLDALKQRAISAAQDVKKRIFEEIREIIELHPAQKSRQKRSLPLPRPFSTYSSISFWRGSPRAWDSIKVSTRL